jgi:hypothetical protein
MPEYDFYATVKADLDQLQRELDAQDVQDGIEREAQRLGVSRELALAALWRASKRHGETLTVFLNELTNQVQRETARTASE